MPDYLKSGVGTNQPAFVLFFRLPYGREKMFAVVKIPEPV
jgi:hypothetical protein